MKKIIKIIFILAIFTIIMTFLEKMARMEKDGKGRIITMPEAQLKLNEMTKEWIYDKVRDEGKGVDFKNKFRIESGTGSDDLKKVMDDIQKVSYTILTKLAESEDFASFHLQEDNNLWILRN